MIRQCCIVCVCVCVWGGGGQSVSLSSPRGVIKAGTNHPQRSRCSSIHPFPHPLSLVPASDRRPGCQISRKIKIKSRILTHKCWIKLALQIKFGCSIPIIPPAVPLHTPNPGRLQCTRRLDQSIMGDSMGVLAKSES